MDKIQPTTHCERFAEFWSLWPNKVAKKTALAKWKSLRLDKQADAILVDVIKRLDGYEPWKKRIYMHPGTYLHQERWNDEWQSIPATQRPDTPTSAYWRRTMAEIKA